MGRRPTAPHGEGQEEVGSVLGSDPGTVVADLHVECRGTIRAGYKKGFATILDASAVTLITAALLIVVSMLTISYFNEVQTIIGLTGGGPIRRTTTLAYKTAGLGLNIEDVNSEIEGDIDLQGLLDLDPEVRSGFREIRVKFKVKGDVDEQTIQELVRKSPVYDTLANPVKIKIEVEKV